MIYLGINPGKGEKLMKALIIKNIDKGLCNINQILKILFSKELNWLISDLQASQYFPEKYAVNENCDWISNREMINYIIKNNITFYWGVFSGFKNEIPLEEVMKGPYPFADGNEKIWVKDVTIQHPLANIEIIVWHYTYILILAKDEDIIQKIKENYPNAKDLLEYNCEQD